MNILNHFSIKSLVSEQFQSLASKSFPHSTCQSKWGTKLGYLGYCEYNLQPGVATIFVWWAEKAQIYSINLQYGAHDAK